MQSQISELAFRPVLRAGHRWSVLCAWARQAHTRKCRPQEKPEAERPVTRIQCPSSEDEVPLKVELASFRGHALWRRYDYAVERAGPLQPSLTVTLSLAGYYGLPATILEALGVGPEPDSKPVLKYQFSEEGSLVSVDQLDGREPIQVRGAPFLADWFAIGIPGSVPGVGQSVLDRELRHERWNCSQVAVFGEEHVVWLSKNLADLQPPQNVPSVSYEVQRWRASAPWWHEAFVVVNGRVDLVARALG